MDAQNAGNDISGEMKFSKIFWGVLSQTPPIHAWYIGHARGLQPLLSPSNILSHRKVPFQEMAPPTGKSLKKALRKGMKERCTLAEMCLAIGIPILMHKDFSTRVCKPCARKIRNANQCYTFIRSNLANESPMNVTPKTSPTTSPVRYKRVLPTTVTTPERNPRPTKKKSSAPAVKSLNYESICEESRDEGIESINNDCVLSALNIEELIIARRKLLNLKLSLFHPTVI